MKRGKEKERIWISVGRLVGKNNHGCIVNSMGVVSVTPRRMQKHLSYRQFFEILLRSLTPLDSRTYEALGGKGRSKPSKGLVYRCFNGAPGLTIGVRIGVV